MSSILSNYAGNVALAAVLKGNTYLSLHTSAPPVASTGSSPTEVAGNGYTRQRVTWSLPSGKGTVTTNRVQFSALPACLVTHFGVWDLSSDGHLLVVIPLSPTLSVDESQALIVEIGDVGLVL